MVKSFKTNLLNWLKTKAYLKTEVDTKLNSKANTSHTHDDRYYTETEMDSKLTGKSDSSHTHSVASSSANGFLSSSDKSKLDGISTGANKTVVDSELNSSSTNPVQNKVVYEKLGDIETILDDIVGV